MLMMIMMMIPLQEARCASTTKRSTHAHSDNFWCWRNVVFKTLPISRYIVIFFTVFVHNRFFFYCTHIHYSSACMVSEFTNKQSAATLLSRRSVDSSVSTVFLFAVVHQLACRNFTYMLLILTTTEWVRLASLDQCLINDEKAKVKGLIIIKIIRNVYSTIGGYLYNTYITSQNAYAAEAVLYVTDRVGV